ncbi:MULTISPECIES: class I SAM-dependent methyltransferase [Lysobacter]|uniref:class I SAM-dependent methyltransferase n=1 Tax=Lysobacter TaxID=68 RepID=UPI001F4861F7|nr:MULTISPECIES: class I SAM-dependent methyltransferase [Lysobacter]UJB21487.1 methyltransferase domain-containing protein [Lysobacter capsici]UJQ29396.1 methyltransferase domain-containing protein [Lysobacter gummosus]
MIDYELELRHHNDVLRRAYAIRAEDRVLDVGCGTGQTTRDAARLATAGTVLGIDSSPEMIERARALTSQARIGNVEYVCADAEGHELPRERFDVAISRFGTMFFSQPVTAFANIRNALRPDGRLVMMVWQPRDRNQWATSIERALASDESKAASASAEPPAFSLGEADVVKRILDSAGFLAPTFEDVRAPVFYGSDVDAAFEFVSEFSTVRDRIAGLDASQRAHAVDRLRDLLAGHQGADGVWFDSRAWIVTAHRG